MRKYLKMFLLLTGVIYLGLSCQKEISKPSEDNFNAAFAKEWYYGTFKKTPEWASSSLKGKKLPDWSHPIIGKFGQYDVIEYPLVKGTKEFFIPGGNFMTETGKMRIVEASLSRILFIRKSKNEIVVREIDYIPDLSYLSAKQYDISKSSTVLKNDDFTGTIRIKKWDGTLLSLNELERGKTTVIKKPSRNSSTNSRAATETCTTETYCIFVQECEWILYGDVMIRECGPWVNTGECWTEEYCQEVDPCIIDPEICGDPDPEPPGGCENMSCEDAESTLAGITTETPNQIEYSNGPESQPDANGIIRKNKDPKWGFFKLNFVGNYFARYTASFSGIVYRPAYFFSWKWETINYQVTTRTGTIPPCVSLDMDVTCSIPLISTDEYTATVAVGGLTWNCEVSISCLGGFRASTHNGSNTLSQDFYAN